MAWFGAGAGVGISSGLVLLLGTVEFLLLPDVFVVSGF